MYIPDLTEIPNLNPYSYEHKNSEDHIFSELFDPIRLGALKVIAIGWIGKDIKNTGMTGITRPSIT